MHSSCAEKAILSLLGYNFFIQTQTCMEASFPGVCSAVYLKKCRQTCAERLREDCGMRRGMRYETGH
jgi:hypothetical protein